MTYHSHFRSRPCASRSPMCDTYTFSLAYSASLTLSFTPMCVSYSELSYRCDFLSNSYIQYCVSTLIVSHIHNTRILCVHINRVTHIPLAYMYVSIRTHNYNICLFVCIQYVTHLLPLSFIQCQGNQLLVITVPYYIYYVFTIYILC